MVSLAVKNSFATRARPLSGPTPPATIANWRSLANAPSRLGGQTAPTTLVVFSDFQCPYCRTLATRLHTVLGEHAGNVGVSFHHYPLMAKHDFAWPAALASECATAQGAFESFHDGVFANQDSLPTLKWSAVAAHAGVRDSAEFERCLKSERYAETVRRDMAIGDSIGLRATPAIIIDGVLYHGALPLEELRKRVNAALAKGPTKPAN
jgi:protein-disulfide isomerase